MESVQEHVAIGAKQVTYRRNAVKGQDPEIPEKEIVIEVLIMLEAIFRIPIGVDSIVVEMSSEVLYLQSFEMTAISSLVSDDWKREPVLESKEQPKLILTPHAKPVEYVPIK